MIVVDAFLTVLAAIVPIVLPGMIVVQRKSWSQIFAIGSYIILWSIGILSLALPAGLLLHIPVSGTAAVVLLAALWYRFGWSKKRLIREDAWQYLFILIVILILVLVFSIPFFLIHDGLPTGDIQKTILWATDIGRHAFLPNYTDAISLLNRDPVDFYTPGLHALAALVLSLSPLPLLSSGIFSIVLAVCVAWIASAIARELSHANKYFLFPILSTLFTLTQVRFLRYLREPGYHFQNIVGELLLFGSLFLAIRFFKQHKASDAFLFFVCSGALFFTHQFSAFIAVCIACASIVALCIQFRKSIIHALQQHQAIAITGSILAIAAVCIAWTLGLGTKIPHLFTSTPHLTSLLPDLIQYPLLMGTPWFFLGLFGYIELIYDMYTGRKRGGEYTLFVVLIGCIFLLSQGPAIGIDIPPVRALFYLAVPLSICAAYFCTTIFSFYRSKTLRVIGIAILLVCMGTTVEKAFGSLSHSVRTNSTLSGELLGASEALQKNSLRGGVLVDDYNRRASSWLVLSGRPMMTRISADIAQQMKEANQSKLRRSLYLNQLQYEKIFSLGSLPEVAALMKTHDIAFVTGITGSSATAFSHNPMLTTFSVAGDTTIFTIADKKIPECTSSSSCAFLFKSSTLANDIGDEEDTFAQLPASIRSPLLSLPKVIGNTTFRETTSSLIPLQFNVGDFVEVLWTKSSSTFVMNLMTPREGLTLITPTGKHIPLPAEKNISVTLAPSDVQIDENGFITLTVGNEGRSLVQIDSIALGPSQIP